MHIFVGRIRLAPILAAAIVLSGASYAMAQSSGDTATADATATVVSGLSLVNSVGLDFGGVVSGATTGTVVISTAGIRSTSGGAALGNAGSASAAVFPVTGEPEATYSIMLPGSTTISSGSHSMTVDTFTSEPMGTGVLTGRSQTVEVGASLHVGAEQPPGSYTGTFDVTVAYN